MHDIAKENARALCEERRLEALGGVAERLGGTERDRNGRVFDFKGETLTSCRRVVAWETDNAVASLLEVLAVLPGVTKDSILESEIGRRISKVSKKKCKIEMTAATADLARWVIQKWKSMLLENEKNAAKTTAKSSPRASESKQNNEDASSAKPRKEKRKLSEMNGSSADESRVRPISPTASAAEKRKTEPTTLVKKKSNSVHHLQALMGEPTICTASAPTTIGLTFLSCIVLLISVQERQISRCPWQRIK